MIYYDLTKLPEQCIVQVQRCFDGDTVRVSGSTFSGIVRIFGIDAPEHGQPFCIESQNYLQSLTRNRVCVLRPNGWDRYNRLVSSLLRDGDFDIGLEMIRQGAAWFEPRFAAPSIDYRLAHVSARVHGLGLWSLPKPHVPPWIFRRKFH